MNIVARTILLLMSLNGLAAYGRARPVEAQTFAMQCAVIYARANSVPIELVSAVIQAESNWNPDAISRKGAAGLMQLMPATAIRFGVRDRFDIEDNVRGGVAYLAWLIQLFHGDLRLAVAAYQIGEAPILRRGLAYSSAEVFEYVARVARLYREMREHRTSSGRVAYVARVPEGIQR